MIDENPNSTQDEQPQSIQPSSANDGFTQVDEIEYVGAPGHLVDEDEVPGCVANTVVYVFALPLALINALGALMAFIYGITGAFSLLIGFFVVMCILLSCLLSFVV